MLAATVSLGRWQLSRAAAEGGAAGRHRRAEEPAAARPAGLPRARRRRQPRCTGRCGCAGSGWPTAHGLPRQPPDARRHARLLRADALRARRQRADACWSSAAGCSATSPTARSSPPSRRRAGLVEVGGQIAPPPAHLLELGKATPAGPDAAPRSSPIRQNLDLEAFRAETGLPLRTDVSLLQTGPASEGCSATGRPRRCGVEKHYGYAFQWFGLARPVAILYVWFQLIAPFRRAPPAVADEPLGLTVHSMPSPQPGARRRRGPAHRASAAGR